MSTEAPQPLADAIQPKVDPSHHPIPPWRPDGAQEFSSLHAEHFGEAPGGDDVPGLPVTKPPDELMAAAQERFGRFTKAMDDLHTATRNDPLYFTCRSRMKEIGELLDKWEKNLGSADERAA